MSKSYQELTKTIASLFKRKFGYGDAPPKQQSDQDSAKSAEKQGNNGEKPEVVQGDSSQAALPAALEIKEAVAELKEEIVKRTRKKNGEKMDPKSDQA